MLVVTANWAYTDGTLVAAGASPRAARAWLRRIRLAAIHAGFGRDAAYRPPASVDIVLAGDTCDGLVSAAWLGRERPWHGGSRTREFRRGVLLGCARRAAAMLAGLARLARRGLEVPAADHRRRPSSCTAIRVPVRIALLVGDRDRHLADAAADVTARGAALAHAWSDGTVVVRHGHENDPVCHPAADPSLEDRPPTLGESLAVDLVTRFAAALPAAGLSRRSVAPLVEAVANSMPLDVPAAIAAWGTTPSWGGDAVVVRQVVADAWCRAVDVWVRETRRMPPDCGSAASPIETLAAWLTGPGTGRPPRSLLELLQPGPPLPAFPGSRRGTARMVVLGHPRRDCGIADSICLGPPAVPRWGGVRVVRADGAADVACVDASPVPAGPTTLVARFEGDRLEWRWITGVEGANAGPADGPAAIVDAA